MPFSQPRSFLTQLHCLCSQVHTRKTFVVLAFKLTEMPKGIKPIFKSLEREKMGTWHFIKLVWLHCLHNGSQRCTSYVIKDALGQTNVSEEKLTDQLSNAVSRRLISTFEDFPSIDQFLKCGEAVKEHEDLLESWEERRSFFRYF